MLELLAAFLYFVVLLFGAGLVAVFAVAVVFYLTDCARRWRWEATALHELRKRRA